MEAHPGDVALSAVELARAVRSRAVSAVEVTRACLDRIAALDSTLRAFQLVRRQKALAEAAELDRRPDLGQLPLAGVPVAIKDVFSVAGEPTRMGSQATPSGPAGSDDEPVRRLRAAGAIVVGKTTLPELAIFGFTESAAFGVTRNPWNHERSAGGSSGGSAAAVAAGMVPIALGSDGLGSIRIPSAFCGVFGLKTSRGLLPLMADLPEHWLGLSVTGPITATVRDAALMLEVLARTTAYAEVRPPARPLRIAVSTRSPTFLAQPAPEIVAAVRASASALQGLGHEVLDADPPYSASLAPGVLRLWMAGVARDAEPLRWEALERRTRGMAGLGKLLGAPPAAFLKGWAAAASEWFKSFDVALMPCTARSSLPAEGWSGKGLVSTLYSQIRALPYTGAWNVAGFPAASVPAGMSSNRVPLSTQLVAPPGGEALLLSVAAQLEAIRPWKRAP